MLLVNQKSGILFLFFLLFSSAEISPAMPAAETALRAISLRKVSLRESVWSAGGSVPKSAPKWPSAQCESSVVRRRTLWLSSLPEAPAQMHL